MYAQTCPHICNSTRLLLAVLLSNIKLCTADFVFYYYCHELCKLNCQSDNISDRAVNWGCCWKAVCHSWGGGGQTLDISWFVCKCYNFIHGKPIFVDASRVCKVWEATKGCVKVSLPPCLILDGKHQRAIGEKAEHCHPCVQLLKLTLDCG